MTTSLTVSASLRVIVVAIVAFFAAATSSAAGAPDVDPRWHAWLGCWVPLTAEHVASGRDEVCVVPTETTSAVEVVSFVDGAVASRTRIDAAGGRRSMRQDDCQGSEEVQWSADGRRVYRTSEASCAAGAVRSTTGLLAIAPEGDWLDIVGANVGGSTAVRLVRYRRRVALAGSLGSDVRSLLGADATTIEAGWELAARAIDGDVIAEASRKIGASVVEAWVNEVRPMIALNARQLIALSDAGVAPRVTDLLVALAYPAAFTIKPRSRLGGVSWGGGGFVDDWLWRDYIWSCGTRILGCDSPWWSDGTGYVDRSLDSYLSYGSWYATGEAVDLVPTGGSSGKGSPAALGHGQVTPRGYTDGSGGSGSAAPRSAPDGSPSSSSSSTSASTSSGEPSGAPAAAPPSGGSEPRTAVPR